jgi:hypothetical protein
MTDDKVKRRLTTVLCADVHGYSRLMEADEAGTLGTLRRHRTAIAGLVARHDGRIVNTWGDAVIAEFASVVEAVQCAVLRVVSRSSDASGKGSIEPSHRCAVTRSPTPAASAFFRACATKSALMSSACAYWVRKSAERRRQVLSGQLALGRLKTWPG